MQSPFLFEIVQPRPSLRDPKGTKVLNESVARKLTSVGRRDQ